MRAFKILLADLRALKNYKFQLILMLVIIILMFARADVYIATNSLIFVGLLLTTLPFTIEGVEKTPQFYATLPIKVSDIVGARYIMLVGYYIFVAIADVIILSTTDFSKLVFEGIELRPFYIGVTALIYLLGVFISTVQFPIFFKIGYEKGNFNSAALYMVPSLLVLMIYSNIGKIDAKTLLSYDMVVMILDNLPQFVILVAVISVALLVSSFFSSCRFLKMREF